MVSKLTVNRRLVSATVKFPKSAEGNGTRQQILLGAVLLFAEKGFVGTSIRDIASEAGINSATLYSHFPSKEHILAKVIEIAHKEHETQLRRALLSSQPDPREQLSNIVRAHVMMHADYPMLAVVANNELHALSPQLGAQAFEARNRTIQLFEEIVSSGVEKQLFDPIDQTLAVTAIAGMGVRVANWYSPEYGKSREEIAEIYAEYARRIVGLSADSRTAI
ncbi:AcrR family transcriptional regulator [Zhongshania antarctica]|uniref:AcrR family transcriptional regulator n=1 Tax=Zhongshania antarctica TaxID=641702 RepID=A0A840R4L1_9GAMM|nr:TetR/AcrR family transcriptional regulator [Zhongshania antarctica]MBB5187466.1 AcrR family transcriptional regulator [Zhongshania antarctica]